MKAATAIVLAATGVSAGAVLALGILIGGDPRDEELYPGLRLESPNGEYVAEFFGLGGSGAAGWANQNLRVAKVGVPFDSDSQIVFRTRYGYQVCLRWLHDGGLLVQYADTATIEEQRKRIEIGSPAQSVDIGYEARESSFGKLRDTNCSGALATVGGVDSEWVVRR